MLMLWMSGGPSWQALTPPAPDHTEYSTQQDNEPTSDHEEREQVMLSSLEAGVIPAGKIQVAFFCTFMQVMALAEQPVERIAGDVPLPQSNYVRTLLRRIISPNAP